MGGQSPLALAQRFVPTLFRDDMSTTATRWELVPGRSLLFGQDIGLGASIGIELTRARATMAHYVADTRELVYAAPNHSSRPAQAISAADGCAGRSGAGGGRRGALNREAESTDALGRGGLPRNSVEAGVMAAEQRGRS
jgi:hypothetical protein